MMWYYVPGMGWWMVLSSLIWLLLIGLAVWAFVRWATHQTQLRGQNPPGPTATGPSAMEILRQRFARGEIDGETFESMRQQLEASGAEVSGAARTRESVTPRPQQKATPGTGTTEMVRASSA